MKKCENCKNALIGRSRTVQRISSTEQLVSDWNIININCKYNHKTSIYHEINCKDYEYDKK